MRYSRLWFVVGAAAVLLAPPLYAQDSSSKSDIPIDPDAPKFHAYKYSPPGARKSVEVGDFYFKKKDYKAALSRYAEAVQEDDTYAPAYLGLGKVYEKIGLKTKALDSFKKYLDTLPSEKDAEDAKDVQRAIARLEGELKKEGSRN